MDDTYGTDAINPTKEHMKVVTHSGPFHADDVMSYVILRQCINIDTLTRTRDPEVIDDADIAFDVGAEYDQSRGRYDHHQKGGAGVRPNGVPYAACGLVWKDYWLDYIRMYDDRLALAEAIDKNIIQGIDALDNGALEDFVPKLRGESDTKVMVQTISTLISSFNPASLIEDGYPEDFDDAFFEAANAIEPFFERMVIGEASRLKAENMVRSCYDGTSILVLDPFCRWQDVVISEMPNVRFVVFENPEGTWMVQVVPVAIGSFEARKPLPIKWAGLRDGEFAEMSGVEDAVFCHPGRFICGARSRGGAMRLAEIANVS